MNQDFALYATPANARRLLRLRMVNEKIKIVHQLVDIAKQGCVGFDDFDPLACPHMPERAAITQFILDCNLRCIVQAPYHPIMNEVAMLNAVRLSGIRPITIVSVSRRAMWRSAINTNFLSASRMGRCDDDVTILTSNELSGSEIEKQRRGALIIDMHNLFVGNGTPANRFMREFPRTILYNDALSGDEMPHWMSLVGTLFPTMPHPTAIQDLKDNPSHYSKMPLQDFALYYNVCLFPEYIQSQKLLEKANYNYVSVCSDAETF